MTSSDRVRRAARSRAWLHAIAILGAVAVILVAHAPLSAQEPTPAPLREQLAAIESIADTEAQRAEFRSLLRRVERGEVPIPNPDSADALAAACARFLDGDYKRSLHTQVARFLQKYPHPAVADALYRAAANEMVPESIRTELRRALIATRDPRAVQLVSARFRDAEDANKIAHLASFLEIATPEARAALEGIAADELHPPELRDQAQLTLARFDMKAELGWANTFPLVSVDGSNPLRDGGGLGPGGVPFTRADELRLARDHFVVVPTSKNEMYELCDEQYPYITADLALHTFMILARGAAVELDRFVLQPRLRELADGFYAASIEQAAGHAEGPIEPLARANACYFAVVRALLDAPPPVVGELTAGEQARVDAEVALVKEAVAADVDVESPLSGQPEDYTLYRPRARHSGRADLEGYFRAMTFLGRRTFRAVDATETGQALAMAALLEGQEKLRSQWQSFDEVLGMFFGERDDLVFADYARVARGLAPAAPDPAAACVQVASSEDLLVQFQASLADERDPRVVDLFAVPDRGSGRRAQSKGLRVMGQRYTRAAHVFEEYTARQLERAERGEKVPTWPPSGLHVAAYLMGSPEATAILAESNRVPPDLKIPVAPADPFGSLADGIVHAASALFTPPASIPAFMTERRWKERWINSALGGWAEQVHTCQLYAKCPLFYFGASEMNDRLHGYVEPVPELFARLRVLTERLAESLERCSFFETVERGYADWLVEQRDSALARGVPEGEFELWGLDLEAGLWPKRENFRDLVAILARLEAISTKCAEGKPQSADDGVYLKCLGMKLAKLAFNKDDLPVAHESMALISDQATEYLSRMCLEVGVGKPALMYVAIPFEGRTYICRGPVYTYYEFIHELDLRLGDDHWRALTADPNCAQRPWLEQRLGR